MKQFLLGPKLYYGANSLEYIRNIEADKIFIVADEMMVKIGIVEKVTKLLSEEGKSYVIFSEVEPDPSLETVEKGLTMLVREEPGCIIAIGGGSPIDAAKAMLLLSIRVQERVTREACGMKPQFVAIPTTSGTGSEVTSYAVVTDRTNCVKIPLSDPLMYPDIAILDEGLTKTVPPSVSADTGMDVLTHAIEAYVSKQASDITDMYAEKAIKDVCKNLLKVYRFGEDLEARGKLHVASCMAGIAFTNAALGINHSLAHTLGGRFHLPHGRSNAILLPYVIAYNAGLFDGSVETSKVAKKYASISFMLGFPCSSTEEGVKSLIAHIVELNKKMGIPLHLQECKIDEAEFERALPEMACSALHDICTTGNPKDVTKEDLQQLLKLIYKGTA
jgi:1-propanol dehydrogenase